MTDPTFTGIATSIGELVEKKQAAYGDSFGRSGAVLRALYPNGIAPEQLDDSLTIVRIVDKLFRIVTNRDALGEDPWRDIMGYALLAVRRVEVSKLKPPLPSEEAIAAIVREVLASGADPFAAATRRAGHYYAENQRLRLKLDAKEAPHG